MDSVLRECVLGLAAFERKLSAFRVSGKALASGFSAAWEPVASAIPLSYFLNGA